MNELMIKKLNETEERRERWQHIFGYTYFQKAKRFHFTHADILAKQESVNHDHIIMLQKEQETLKQLLCK